jgi:putative ABC transport system ATP-binding protein
VRLRKLVETGAAIETVDPGPPPGPSREEAPAPPAVIELRGVGKEYPGPPRTRALQGVDLVVRRGEFIAVVGPSGSGKSTLLNLLGALDRPSAGALRIAGHDVSRLADRELAGLRGQHLGFVFQSFNLLDGVDATENVSLGLLYGGIGRRQRRARALDALDRVGLADRARHRPAHLSGGERQRVAIARALVHEPSLLLADEPTGNLDSRNGAAILDLFGRLHAEGSTIVLITHDPGIAAGLPRCVTLRDGSVERDERRGPPALALAGAGETGAVADPSAEAAW